MIVFALYEEDGDFKVGSILSETEASLAIEALHGKRSKVKANHVLMRFREPTPGELMPKAQAIAETLELDFLWEASGDAEFGFAEMAAEYFGHAPSAIESAGILIKLHSAPMYFHRKARGRYRAAPPDTLKAALAGLEKKRLQGEQISQWVASLNRFEMPLEIVSHLPELLYKPDRNRIETKAIEQACNDSGLSIAKLVERCGAMPSSYEFHRGRFLFAYFPRGTGFPKDLSVQVPDDLERAEVAAFSLDDATTTEIDDALSLTRLPSGLIRVGIHIAAPGLAVRPDSPIGEIARDRLSTVYMPGDKITMLPSVVIDAFSLAEGSVRPALSMYVDVDPESFEIRNEDSRIEAVPIAANIRHHAVEHLNALFATGERDDTTPFGDELHWLHRFALTLEAGRGQAGQTFDRPEYSFHVENDQISITERKRGAPLDKLVAEMMILVNRSWGKLLADHDAAAIYRSQSQGKVRMTTAAGEHQGLGVSHYAWSSSPLRRYIDLINQWQLIALLSNETPPFARNSASLLGAIRDFELTYAAYGEFQERMEHYWCLRWLLQHQKTESVANVVRENVVKFRDLPLFVRVPSLPPGHTVGDTVIVTISAIDLVDATIEAVYKSPASVAIANDTSDVASHASNAIATP